MEITIQGSRSAMKVEVSSSLHVHLVLFSQEFVLVVQPLVKKDQSLKVHAVSPHSLEESIH
jgi:hypothetical protein